MHMCMHMCMCMCMCMYARCGGGHRHVQQKRLRHEAGGPWRTARLLEVHASHITPCTHPAVLAHKHKPRRAESGHAAQHACSKALSSAGGGGDSSASVKSGSVFHARKKPRTPLLEPSIASRPLEVSSSSGGRWVEVKGWGRAPRCSALRAGDAAHGARCMVNGAWCTVHIAVHGARCAWWVQVVDLQLVTEERCSCDTLVQAGGPEVLIRTDVYAASADLRHERRAERGGVQCHGEEEQHDMHPHSRRQGAVSRNLPACH